ncbi:general secretion pathway protein E/type IV pilus assembly protein PilB [Limimonas halophila]|uniref:General secretion pathway protein E/type IV pilus assembly protein PilB n=1 Tax=Limimonas halophila TaxID=1082479 RepID=A0A1G7NPB5_9PROT|nr:GspE/PulE family protein [Limimonas halophila]SDF75120.1 general secretion pathway protein E/type IV pilus assembly protein PilB [Limimonas halophila]
MNEFLREDTTQSDDSTQSTTAPAAGTSQRTVKLGERLIQEGVIAPDQLEVALREQKRTGTMLGEALVNLGFITDVTLAATLAESSGFSRFSLKNTVLDTEIVKKIPKSVAHKYAVLPVAMDEDSVQVAMADIYDVVAIDQLRRYFPRDREIVPMVASRSEISEAIDAYFGYEMTIDSVLQEIEEAGAEQASVQTGEEGFINPTVRLANAIILDAVKRGASDIHLEPENLFVRLRYRIDGVMTPGKAFHKQFWSALSVRLKIMSGMNIAESRQPQDGRFTFQVAGREVDFRVASHPTVYGENIVLRILDKAKSLRSLESLGYEAERIRQIKKMALRPEGIIVVTGPTGSGKTTTLYSLLNYLNTMDANIMTLEEPVEYELPVIRQSHVGERMSFGEGVRSILRQDPDIVFIGEVRDEDTANMALRAAMTGHKVFTTLHTNDAVGAVNRLLDFGLSANMLAGNVIGVLAQRLLRTLCEQCKRPRPATAKECSVLRADPEAPPTVYEPVGCEHCNNTGYAGRTAVVETLPFSDEIDELMAKGATRREIMQAASENGFVSLAESGLTKVRNGETSVEEVIKTVNLIDRL